MTDHIMAAILVVITSLLNITFARSVLFKKRFGIRELLLILLMPIYGFATAILFSKYVIVKLIISFVLDTVVVAAVFQITIKKSLLVNALFNGIYISTEMIAMVIYQYNTKMWSFADITNSNGAFIVELLCQLLLLIIIIVISAFRKSSNLSQMDVKGWIAFIIFPVITVVMMMIMMRQSSAEIIDKMYNEVVFFTVSMLLLNLMLFYLLDNLIERENEIHEKQILIEQAEHINLMYRSLSEEREKQRSRSHDYLNILNVMLKMAESGNRTEEIAFIKEQIGKEIDCTDIIDTGNAIINAVLNIKYQEARSREILFPIVADNLSNLKVSDSDLVTILTNIIDNAIEAASHTDDKRMVLKIIKNEDMLCIDSSNPFVGNIDFEKHRFTTKNDPTNHGYGLSNVKRVVQSNDGECFIEMQNNIYHITILIPLL